MRHIHLHILLICAMVLLSTGVAQSQRVGLVLSGGGAKGCAHIGVIRALEEEGIPIDYIAGTSMGAIVSSLYAMGYSPEQMTDLLSSEQFLRWKSGDIDEHSLFFFKRDDPSPEFISFKVNLRDSTKNKANLLIPSSVMSSDQINIAMMDLFSKANATCKGDFDSLFVPFRCVASDVTHKCAYVHRKGDLGDAVRTSMSFPFVFKPIQVDGRLMLDGGIYNNFPVDVMEKEFNPDYIIGSSVTDNPTLDADNKANPMPLLETLIMDETKYEIPDNKGILIDFHLSDVGLLDFHRLKELEQMGYDSTKARIKEIKERVKRYRDPYSLTKKREEYLEKEKDLLFQTITIRGVSEAQRKYLYKSLYAGRKKKALDMNAFQRAYFKLLSDDKISEIIPHAVYKDSLDGYELILDVNMNSDLGMSFGGNFSSTAANILYLGVQKRGVRNLGYNIALDGQVGMLYKNVHIQSRIDNPGRIPLSMKVIADYSNTNSLNEQEPFYKTDIKNNVSTQAYYSEVYAKVKFLVPFSLKGKVDLGICYGHKSDHYHRLPSETDKWNETNYDLGIGLIQYKHNSLSHKQYAVDGSRFSLTGQYILGTQWSRKYIMNDDGLLQQEKSDRERLKWFQLSANMDYYFTMGKHFSLGTYLDGVYSTVPLMDNYMESLLISPSFTPSVHNHFVFNSAFCAHTYFSAGIAPIYKFNKLLHIRFENYAFMSYKPIMNTGSYHSEYRKKKFSDVYFFNELSFVANLKFITAALYINRYTYPGKINMGLNIGYLLFHDRMIEK